MVTNRYRSLTDKTIMGYQQTLIKKITKQIKDPRDLFCVLEMERELTLREFEIGGLK